MNDSAACNNMDKSHKDNWMTEANHKRNKVMVRKKRKDAFEMLVMLLVDLEAGYMNVNFVKINQAVYFW